MTAAHDTNDLDDLLKERVVARVAGEERGPTLVVVGGLHGNEPAGLRAGRKVCERLGQSDVRVRGEVVVLGGNLSALRARRRFFDRDMNRGWTEKHMADVLARAQRVDGASSGLENEDREQFELYEELQAIRARARGPLYLIDLHTTSASGVPFAVCGRSPAQRLFVSALPLPLIFGLESQLEGVLSIFSGSLGFTTVVVEGGQHDEPESLANLEAALYLAVESAGVVREGDLREGRDAWKLLEGRRGALPRVMEVVNRHAIGPEDEFKMEPGFRNLDHARAGQLLARDKRGEIRAPQDGLVLLPLYQGQGSDGFFWGRPLPTESLSEPRLGE